MYSRNFSLALTDEGTSMNQCSWFGLFLALLTVGHILHSGIASAEERTWTDRTGKYELEAEFVALKKGRVELDFTVPPRHRSHLLSEYMAKKSSIHLTSCAATSLQPGSSMRLLRASGQSQTHRANASPMSGRSWISEQECLSTSRTPT